MSDGSFYKKNNVTSLHGDHVIEPPQDTPTCHYLAQGFSTY